MTPQEHAGKRSPTPAPMIECKRAVATVPAARLLLLLLLLRLLRLLLLRLLRLLLPRNLTMVVDEGSKARATAVTQKPASSQPLLALTKSWNSYFIRHGPRIEDNSTSAGDHGPSSSSSHPAGCVA